MRVFCTALGTFTVLIASKDAYLCGSVPLFSNESLITREFLFGPIARTHCLARCLRCCKEKASQTARQIINAELIAYYNKSTPRGPLFDHNDVIRKPREE